MTRTPRRLALITALLVLAGPAAARASATAATTPPTAGITTANTSTAITSSAGTAPGSNLPDLDTAPAKQALEAFITANQEAADDIGTCPLGPASGFLAQAPASLGLSETFDDQASLIQQQDSWSIMCHAAGAQQGEIYAGEPFAAGQQTALTAILDADFTTSFAPETDYRGGKVLTYCASSKTASDGFCEADWYNGDVQYGVSLNANGIDAALVTEWLYNALDDLNAATASIDTGAAATPPGSGSTAGTTAGTNLGTVATTPAGSATPAATPGTGVLAVSDAASNLAALVDGMAPSDRILSTCPLGDVSEIVALAPPELQSALHLDSSVLAAAAPQSDSMVLVCQLGSGDGQFVTVLAGTAFAGDPEAALRNDYTGATVTFATTEPYRGGAMLSFCATKIASSQDACEAQWLGPGIRLALHATVAESLRPAVVRWLQDSLDTLAARVAAATLAGADATTVPRVPDSGPSTPVT